MFRIDQRVIGQGNPVYIVAELSANHGHDYERAVASLEAAHAAGADAVKLQTYRADTLTIDCSNDCFQIQDTIWHGKNLFQLYQEAYTPWEWFPKLQQRAKELGINLFSAPFDFSAVDFLEQYDPPVYKIASFEIVDLPLIEYIAQTGKPVIMSTGMASLGEIEESVQTFRRAGGRDLCLLKCTSAYPAGPDSMNLKTIAHLAETFDVPVGLSDHTLGINVPLLAVAMGACMIEKHFTLSRDFQSPDSAFSLEPAELKELVDNVRIAEKAMGRVHYGGVKEEEVSAVFRRSLFVVADMNSGDVFSSENIRSIRPGYGLHTRYLPDFIGHRVRQDVSRGTPLSWDLLD